MEIQVKGLSKSFCQASQNVQILANVNLHFFQQSSYALIGASGSGKSTLLHLLGGFEKPDQGEVVIINQQPQRPKFGVLFQQDFLIEELDCQENVALAGVANNQSSVVSAQKALELLKFVGMEAQAKSYPCMLSGGQKIRVALCRALLVQPQFLLADEPTSNLDQTAALQILELLLNFKKELGMGIIICSHDPHIYSQMEHVFKVEQQQVLEVDNF